jgi:hypothetical protein
MSSNTENNVLERLAASFRTELYPALMRVDYLEITGINRWRKIRGGPKLNKRGNTK